MDYSNGIKVVVGNEGFYAQGQLQDQAITLPVSDSELRDFLKDNGLVTPEHEETYIADFPDGAPFGNSEIFEHTSIQDVNLLAKQMEMAEPEDLDKVDEWIGAFHDPKNVTQLMNLIAQADLIEKVDFEYTGGDTPEENYGYYVLDQNPTLKEAMEATGIAVDYQKTGYDRSIQDEVTLTDTGFIIDSGSAPDMDKFSREDLADLYGDEPEVKASLDSNIKEWFMEKFPADELGAEINESLTFDDAFSAIENGNDVYDALGVHDSVVRERLFDGLSEATGKSYGAVYNVWLKGAEKTEGKDAKPLSGLDAKTAETQEACDALSALRGSVDAPGIDPR